MRGDTPGRTTHLVLTYIRDHSFELKTSRAPRRTQSLPVSQFFFKLPPQLPRRCWSWSKACFGPPVSTGEYQKHRGIEDVLAPWQKQFLEIVFCSHTNSRRVQNSTLTCFYDKIDFKCQDLCTTTARVPEIMSILEYLSWPKQPLVKSSEADYVYLT